MNATELRIGNWVKYTPMDGESTFIQLVEISKNDDFEDCEPIPLTEEILKSAGFVYVEDMVLNQDLSRWEYTFENYGKVCEIYLTDGSCNFSDREDQQLNYVHQLQNLFYAMSGRELEIKLPLEITTK